MSAISWLREHPRALWGATVVGALAVGVGVGRFTAPSRVEELERSTSRTVSSARTAETSTTVSGPMHKAGRTVVEVLPGGGRRTTTDWTLDRGPTIALASRATEQTKVETVEVVKERLVEREAPRLTVGASAGLQNLTPVYGGWATYRVAGPLVLLGAGEGGAGAWAARVGVGINF